MHAGDAAHQVVAVERHRQDIVDALARIDVDRVLRHRQHDHRDADAVVVQLLHQLHAPKPALEQCVDHDDVRAVLGDTVGNERAIGHDVDQADVPLRCQEAADVLRDLWHVFDQEQANLIGGSHRRNGTTGVLALRR